MPNHVLVNNVDHKDIKINTTRSAELGDNLWFSPTFVAEFNTVQAHYPILFQKDPTNGKFIPVTLFGFTQNENLFLQDNKWDASYIPLSVRRYPFYIGVQNNQDRSADDQRVITLDMDSPRVNTQYGQPLFMPYGGNSEYLENIAEMLEALHQGLLENAHFVDTLLQHDLLESVTLDIELRDSSRHQLIGFYTINEQSLHNLPEGVLMQLHQRDYLQAIYMIIASQAHINKLVERKNQRLVTAQ